MNSVLLSTAYLAPTQYYSKLISYPTIFIEYYEHYAKQSYRNRCNILSANGPLSLSIPVQRGSESKILTQEVRIDNHCRWKSVHLKAIESAYRSSPFYIYYIDDLLPIFNQTHEFLVDFNSEIQNAILDLLSVKANIIPTQDFRKAKNPFDDYVERIHPKSRMMQEDPTFNPTPYYQVFESKFGFIPNLSILDLLFNVGPSALEILQSSTVAGL
jgi:hypothetical protein